MPIISRRVTSLAAIWATLCLLSGLTDSSWANSYVYDDLNRVTEVHYDSTDWIQYVYDEVGNIISKIPHGNVVTITPTSNSGGSISPPGTVSYFAGSGGAFTVTPQSGYLIANVMVDGVAKGPTLSGPYSVPFSSVAHTLAVDFEPSSYTVTFKAADGGTVTGTTPQTVNYGGRTTAVSASPSNGNYSFLQWTGTGGFVSTNSNPLTLTNVTSNQTITANFSVGPCGEPHVQITGKGNYSSIQDAYNAASTGDVIKVIGLSYTEGLNANLPISVTIDGGYICDFSYSFSATTLYGTPVVSNGTVTMKNLIIHN